MSLRRNLKKSARAEGGPCSWVCACETLRLAPHGHEQKISPHVSAESPSNISPNPSEVISKVLEPWDNFWKCQSWESSYKSYKSYIGHKSSYNPI